MFVPWKLVVSLLSEGKVGKALGGSRGPHPVPTKEIVAGSLAILNQKNSS